MLVKQGVQLLQRGRAICRVVKYNFAVIQSHSSSFKRER